MIAIDTNVLVFAHRPECPSNELAFACLRGLASSPRSWGTPLHCLVEFTAVVTNPRIWRQPSTLDHVDRQVGAWLEAPRFHVLAEDRDWWPIFRQTLETSGANGGQIHDARIAACCRYHDVTELWTADRDFSRYPWLRTRNPLVK